MEHETLEALYEQFDAIIAEMEDSFDSHDFIQALAQRHQKLYIEALYVLREGETPFRTLHSALAKQLAQRKDLTNTGDTRTANIFGEKSPCATWAKA